jgi:hypothetical protein
MDNEKLDLKTWLDQYDAFMAERAAQEVAEPRRECGVCPASATYFCSKCKPLLQ